MKIFVLIRQDFFFLSSQWCIRSTSLQIGSSAASTCEKNNIESVCGNSKFSHHSFSSFVIFLSSANSGCLRKQGRCMKKQETRSGFFFCLSRLYFALNRIQGSLQIDKKKKKGGKQAFWNVRKVETIRVQKKDKMKRKHSSGVRKM